jgi:hypothetical protein
MTLASTAPRDFPWQFLPACRRAEYQRQECAIAEAARKSRERG